MSVEFYVSGYEVGRYWADECAGQIRMARDMQRIGAIAGKRLDAIRHGESKGFTDWKFKTASWGDGFFDGFMDRADAIRARRPDPPSLIGPPGP